MADFNTAMNISKIAILSAGIVGNIISFIVFSRKTFRNNSISTYCRALAILDCLVVIELVKLVIVMNKFMFLENVSDAWCKIYFYVSMQYTAIPGWILVAFSVDKMLNMSTSPFKILKSKLFQWSVVAGIVLFHLLIFIELLVSLRLEPIFFIFYVCNFSFLSYLTAFIYALVTESCILPFLIMIISSAVTIRMLMKSKATLHRIGQEAKKRRIRDIKFAISSLTFNFFFIAFKTPFFISYFVPSSLSTFYFSQWAFLLFMINCSANFFIHFASNSIFRREVLILLRINKATSRVSSLLQTSKHNETNQRIFNVTSNA